MAKYVIYVTKDSFPGYYFFGKITETKKFNTKKEAEEEIINLISHYLNDNFEVLGSDKSHVTFNKENAYVTISTFKIA